MIFLISDLINIWISFMFLMRRSDNFCPQVGIFVGVVHISGVVNFSS